MPGLSKFEEVSDWLTLPRDWAVREASSISIDSSGRLYVAHRGEHPLFVIQPDGSVWPFADNTFTKTFLYEPRTKMAARDHSQYWLHGLLVDGQDNVWVTDIGRSIVMKFDPQGNLLLTLGTDGQAGDGINEFYQPTDVAIGPAGDIYVSDGYGNSRVVRFSATGEYISSWGRFGTGLEEFDTPHGIAVSADGRVFVAERLNGRVQVFDSDGAFLAVWPDIARADAIRIGADGGVYVGTGKLTDSTLLRFRPDGTGREQLASHAQIGYPHAFCLDRGGTLYAADPIEHTVRKFRSIQ